MVIFHCYVKLPEGMFPHLSNWKCLTFLQRQSRKRTARFAVLCFQLGVSTSNFNRENCITVYISGSIFIIYFDRENYDNEIGSVNLVVAIIIFSRYTRMNNLYTYQANSCWIIGTLISCAINVNIYIIM